MSRFSKLVPSAVFFLGATLTIWLASNLNDQIEADARDAFQKHAFYFQTSVSTRLQSYEDILFGLAGLYRSNKDVSPQEFRAYAETLDIGTRNWALESVNYAQYIPRFERDRFLTGFGKEIGASTKNVVPPYLPPDQDGHMVITRVFPPSSFGLGANLLVHPRSYSQSDWARLSANMYEPNKPFSAGLPVRLAGNPHTGMGMRLGIFDGSGAGKPLLRGTVGIAFDVDRFFQRVIPASLEKHLTYRLSNIGRVDGTPYPNPVLIFDSRDGTTSDTFLTADTAGTYSTSFALPFGGALLQFELAEAKSHLINFRDRALPFAVLLVGLLGFGMASMLVRRSLLNNARLSDSVKSTKAGLLQEMNKTKKLEHELSHAADEERHRIGRELHDDLGQRLTGISLGCRALSETLHPIFADLSQQAAALEQAASQAISSVRGLAHGLMEIPPGGEGLRDALEQLATSASSHVVRCVFDFDDPVDIDNEDVANNLYRIAQEALSNAIRHSVATVVHIRLDYEHGKVVLSIADNGIGFQHQDSGTRQTLPASGAGLRIMAYRASAINFKLSIKSSIGNGTTIRVQEC